MDYKKMFHLCPSDTIFVVNELPLCLCGNMEPLQKSLKWRCSSFNHDWSSEHDFDPHCKNLIKNSIKYPYRCLRGKSSFQIAKIVSFQMIRRTIFLSKCPVIVDLCTLQNFLGKKCHCCSKQGWHDYEF